MEENKFVEKDLAKYIITRYGTVKDFAIRANLPYTTVYSMLSRGLGKAHFKPLQIQEKYILGKDEVTSSNLVISSTYNLNVFKALRFFLCPKSKYIKVHKST